MTAGYGPTYVNSGGFPDGGLGIGADTNWAIGGGGGRRYAVTISLRMIIVVYVLAITDYWSC